MRRGGQARRHGIATTAALLVLGVSTPASSDPPTASLRCERAAAPGRVRCAVEARPAAQRVVVAGDVVITALPSFASALRARLGDESLVRPSTGRTWEFALVAKSAGRGEVHATVRLVVCVAEADGGASERCVPETVDVATELLVAP